MKMDLDYIKKLLNILNDCDDDRVELRGFFRLFLVDQVYKIKLRKTELYSFKS